MTSQARPLDPPLLWTLAAAALLAALSLWAFAWAAAALLSQSLVPPEQAQWQALLADHWAVLLLPAAVWVGAAMAGVAALHRRFIAAPARLAEQVQARRVCDGPAAIVPADWPSGLRALARAIEELAVERDRLRQDIAAEAARAAQGIEQERNRLAALMSELTLGVVACNLDGRVLLYNTRARLQFRALWGASSAWGGAELLGLGRSIYAALDRQSVASALESLQTRLQRGADAPTVEFIAGTPDGHLLRVQMAPVKAVDEPRAVAQGPYRSDAAAPAGVAGRAGPQINGFVLTLQNITHEAARAQALEQRLQGFTTLGRDSLSRLEESLRAAQAPAAPAAAVAQALQSAHDALTRLEGGLQALEQGLAAPAPAQPQSDDGAQATADDSRPVFYDFELFAQRETGQALEDRPLAELSFTVFDTETTGLDPAGGDEIIQIGAVRLVNGKLLAGERFDQLIDPQRPIPRASVPIHGLTTERVRGQPTIEQVLPAFHRWAHDTVLVAHNAAFDMRFLQLKEAVTGVRFDQPLLDTLLLSAAVNPSQDTHSLEAIAARLGVEVAGRHTALGDARVTAEIFLRLIPLLAERGIHTLGQAREAALKTRYARLEY